MLTVSLVKLVQKHNTPGLQLQLPLQLGARLDMLPQPQRPHAVPLVQHEVVLLVPVRDAVVGPAAALRREQAEERRAVPGLLGGRLDDDQFRFRLEEGTTT